MTESKPFYQSIMEITESCFSDFYISFPSGLHFLPYSDRLIYNLELIEKLVRETEIPEEKTSEMIEKFQEIIEDFESNNYSILSLSMLVDTKKIKKIFSNIIFNLELKREKHLLY
ncbi:hypothetical protein K9M50_02265 [Patescibacteria group bacterium]|nr:hypothetical protein [Patescibacteria group bacterium]